MDINSANVIKYSWDNIKWYESAKSISFNLKNGIYDLYYSNGGNNIYHQHYIIDNKSPVVFSNYESDLYNSPILVNLTALDNIDENPKIYYTIDGSNPLTNGKLYVNPITISKTTHLKFYSIDFNNIKSNVVTCNYMYSQIANLNSGKEFSSIQSAIDDKGTFDGDTIKIAPNIYSVNLVLNKNLNIIGDRKGNVKLRSSISSQPVLKITSKGSKSLIYGINVLYSSYGFYLDKTTGIVLMDNQFEHCMYSINCDNDINTTIINNKIDSSSFVSKMIGINCVKSNNLIISNNSISLASDINSIAINLNGEGSNISVTDNNILNHMSLGRGILIYSENVLVENNNISNFVIGIQVNSIYSKFYNNQLYDNYYGFDFVVSGFNSYKSNNIFNNNYGVYLSSSFIGGEDEFYLNRLANNKNYDFYSDANYYYNIDNNWWGTNNPSKTNKLGVIANIYDGKSNTVMKSWIQVNSFTCSYDVSDEGYIDRTKVYLETNYNNLGEDLAIKGYIPDNTEVLFTLNSNVYKSYLKNGIAFCDVKLNDCFISNNDIDISTTFDNQNIKFTLNKRALINTSVFSTAIDVATGKEVSFNYLCNYSNVTWITYAWEEIGLYNGILYEIVNGEVVNSINFVNKYYQNYKNLYPVKVFEAIKLFNNVFASTKEGVWSPNDLYMSFVNTYNLIDLDRTVVENLFLELLKYTSGLSDNEVSFIRENSKYFVDSVMMIVDYHGEFGKKINYNYNCEDKLTKMPEGYAMRISNVYYTNILDENGENINYEGMRSFAISKHNITDNDLRYWLNQKELYAPGLMKAAYGTFLTSLLVIYENDRVADDSAIRYNVSWKRIAPVCVSLCNDFNCLYITGESDHTMGREVIGNSENIWEFNFATSFSFSLNEQIVGSNIWEDNTIGSVTLGLLQDYMNNETLEIFTSDNYVFIKNDNSNNSMLIIDLESGIVRDIFNFHGLLGTMPCYHDNKTDNAISYAEKLLDYLSDEFKELQMIFAIGGVSTVLFDGLEIVGFGVADFSLGPLLIIGLPIAILVAPDQVNDAWKKLMYLLNPNYKDYPDIPIYDNNDPNNPIINSGNIIDENSNDNFKIIPNKKSIKTYNKVNFYRRDSEIKIGPVPDGKDSNDTDWDYNLKVGKYIRELYDGYKKAKQLGKGTEFALSHLKELLIISLYFETIDLVDFVLKLTLFEFVKESLTKK